MGLTLQEAHELESQLRIEMEKRGFKLDTFYPSTWKAIDAYYEILYGHKFFKESTND